MTKTGFLEHRRRAFPHRPVAERVNDNRELYVPLPMAEVSTQASRCMECAVPFCHQGCPLGNLIPEWNDLVGRDDWRRALSRLLLTNNFPEFTGRLCPAPCEPACVLSINDDPVTIKNIEVSIIERGFREGWVVAEPPAHRTGRRVAVVGSGPAGLAAAQQLNRQGHEVVVFEKSDREGGLVRYGIPDFKIERWVLDRRLALLEAEGISFEPGCDVGVDIDTATLRREFDAVLLAVGAERARDVELPGRHLDGVHLAMDYLVQRNRVVAGEQIPHEMLISAAGRDVVIIGGGDTAADCLGNSHRERCASARQLIIYPEPPSERPVDNPWPQWPLVLRLHPAHDEGGAREYSVQVTGFSGDGRVEAIDTVEVERTVVDGAPRFAARPGTERTIPANLVLLAIGFAGVRESPLYEGLGVSRDAAGRIVVDPETGAAAPGVFACGDATLGASLIVTAMADARTAAAACARFLGSGVPSRT